MKIVICTTPIRPTPTSYPPFGSMAVIRSLRDAGYDPQFYDIDGLRPPFEQVVEWFRDQAPDLVGISAVVSTAYAYTKKLASAIKEVSPKTKIVVGGNLAASAEILLRFCNVDVCAIGEGEKVIVNLVNYWESHGQSHDNARLKGVKGIAFLDENDEMVFTGYEAPIPAGEFFECDWTLLEQNSKIENFVTNPLDRYDFAQDPRSHEPHRRGKKLAIVTTAKGCVARCTFCHRWDRGYRHRSVDLILDNVKHLMVRYNVGFISFGDENFGSDRRKLDDLLERLKPLDVLWQVGGVRCRSVDPELLSRMKDSGCVALYYGMESGSPRILDVMEKNTTLQQNIDAALWTYAAGMYTIYQMVLGMPGEDNSTIKETGDFITSVTEFLPEPPHERLSLNYIQALPGTPVYEYARSTGLIGKTLEDEEAYLISISDTDAVDDTRFLNFTQSDSFTIQSWSPKILFEAEANWYRKRDWKAAAKAGAVDDPNISLPDTEADEDYKQGGYFNLREAVIRHPVFYRVLSFPLCYLLRNLYLAAYVIAKDIKKSSKKQFFGRVWEFFSITSNLRKRPVLRDFRSLRIVVKDQTSAPHTESQQSMQPLRDGR